MICVKMKTKSRLILQSIVAIDTLKIVILRSSLLSVGKNILQRAAIERSTTEL
jgi:hypothetical protein